MSSYYNINTSRMHGMDREEQEEMDFTRRNQTPQHTGSDCVKMGTSRAAPVCLVLLCFLLLMRIIALGVHISTNNTNYTNPERDQLLTKITKLTEERDQLLTRIRDLEKEKDQILTKNMQPTEDRDQWIYNKSSLYFISSVEKSWTDSRRYCRERGADLVIINNRDEQDFVKKTFAYGVWIGLTDSDVEGRWKWVDDRAVTSGFWDPREPNGGKRENCALSDSSGWADYPCDYVFKCVCEYHIN